ncbi:MAG: winged helix DNA-binding domain-containing protein [Gordonia sp. (in: high G+C Gram-positive bacteria)]
MASPLTGRQWNRTLLARQHLIERIDEDAIEVLDRCVGLQSQDPQAAFFGLWSRIDGFDPVELDDLLSDREVVRMTLQRGTVFLMDALDARWIRRLLQPGLDAVATRSHTRQLRDVDVDEVVGWASGLFTGDDASSPIPAKTLRDALAAHWPDESVDALIALVRNGLPLVQAPPRGLWKRSGGLRYQLLDRWIGPGEPGVTGDEARKDLIRMYLRGFGPATVAAVQTWSGLTGLGPLMEQMDADWELCRLTGPAGQPLFDLDGLPLSDDETVPVRFVAPFDNVLVANADRARIADPDVYAQTVTPNGISPGFVLIDGRLSATWRLVAGRVALTGLRDLQPAERAEAEREAAVLQEFADGRG